MSDLQELSFVIPGYTPETIPLDRLIDYLKELSIVLGDPKDLHLVEIQKSSVKPVLRAPIKTTLEAKEAARRVQRGEGTGRQNKAYNKLRRMVRTDTSAGRHDVRNALLSMSDRTILEIPAAHEDTGIIDGLRQATSIDGQLIRVGGPGDEAALQLQTLDGQILSGFTAKRHLAKDLAELLWGPSIRLNGTGIWCRDEEGVWKLSRMQVLSYELLDDEDVTLTLERLRALKVEWPEDTIQLLLNERDPSL